MSFDAGQSTIRTETGVLYFYPTIDIVCAACTTKGMVKIAAASRVMEAGMASLIQSSLVMILWEGWPLSWHNQW